MPDPSPKWRRTKANAKESINKKKVGQKWSEPQAFMYTDDDANVPKQSTVIPRLTSDPANEFFG